MEGVRVAIIGSGQIALANHLPGFARCSAAAVVALCDSNPEVLQRAARDTGITVTSTDYHDVLTRDDIDAVVIATPTVVHAPIALDAIAAGKHVLCEKPLAMNLGEALAMYRSAEAAGVRHMTAFTYRFVPAMRYMAYLVEAGAIGRPYHFRANRFQDWGQRDLGWRQVARLAGSGELGDMLSHRIDFGHLLVGPLARLVARTRRFVDERGGRPSELEDWAAILGDFSNGATGVWESSKLTSGRGEGSRSQDYCELNGSDGTLVYLLGRPNEVQRGSVGGTGLATERVPEEFLTWPGSPRDPRAGDPLVTFRYDQNVEFIDAILEGRPCRPSFRDGARAQAVLDAALASDRDGGWAEVPEVEEFSRLG